MNEDLFIAVFNEGEVPKELADLLTEETLVKGAAGLDRYRNDPRYQPKETLYNRGGHMVHGIVYERKGDTKDIKSKVKAQHEVEKHNFLKGKHVKLHFKDDNNQHHSTNKAEIHSENEHNLFVKLTSHIRHEDGSTAHEKGKIIKVPKLKNKDWLAHNGDHRVEHQDSN